ncbi:CPBP family intramembrane glutamic endopeptidase [Parvimonas micra]|uniref:CPBP family intramembrane glutamic endopeptidase n=1 Tax=Parvimonas micra TaxID=33033 RepID=UPI0022B695C1|nr:CPBP family intramembrane glutamic endopeptidase [Parvimonas micra]WBB29101.1 CPBP family intramembrane metalloprotease [Parvimonas micra]
MINVKNFKKWIFPALMFIFFEFIFRQKILNSLFFGKIFIFKFFENPIVNNFFVGGICCLFGNCIIFLIIKYIFNGKLNSIDNSEKMDLKKSIIISILVFVFTMLIIYLASYIESILKLEVYSLNAKNTRGTERLNLFVSLFSIASVNIFEELVYRRILFGYLYDLHSGCNKYIRIITSMIISSIIFGSTHDGVFHLAMIQYIIYGISFSAIYLYTKRISASITVHILVNIFIIIMRFF